MDLNKSEHLNQNNDQGDSIMEDYYADFEEELKLNFEYFKAQEGQPL